MATIPVGKLSPEERRPETARTARKERSEICGGGSISFERDYPGLRKVNSKGKRKQRASSLGGSRSFRKKFNHASVPAGEARPERPSSLMGRGKPRPSGKVRTAAAGKKAEDGGGPET